MSLKALRRLAKAIGFRLTAWYFGLFTLSVLVLFGTAYVLLAVTMQRKDREAIQFELQEYLSEYQRGGLETVEKEIALQQGHSGKILFFVRVADRENRTLSLTIPHRWNRFDLVSLETASTTPVGSWLRIPAKRDEEILEIASARAADGTLIQVGLNTEGREDVLEHFRNLLAAIMLPVMLLGLIGGAVLAARALRPIRGLTRTMQVIFATNTLTARALVKGTNDELDELSALFNGMLDKIAMLIHGMQRTLDNVAHDLRTPMTRLRGMAELALQADAHPDHLYAALSNCVEESERILTMLNTLMDVAEAETGTMRLEVAPVNVHHLVDQIVDLYGDVAEEKAITISTVVPPELAIDADSTRMQQALANLVDNAIKYTPHGGKVDITARANHHHVSITVADTGSGITPEDLPHIWERLYRGDTSRSQRGLGLGLSLVKAIVQAHHGEVAVSSQLGQGARFSLTLPLTRVP